jgi:hypothetical protein
MGIFCSNGSYRLLATVITWIASGEDVPAELSDTYHSRWVGPEAERFYSIWYLGLSVTLQKKLKKS